MDLREGRHYRDWGLPEEALERLALFGDLLRGAQANVTGVRDPGDIERIHFLDSLSLLGVPEVRGARSIADVGSGGGLPAVVLAVALPGVRVVAVESVGKKCAFIRSAAERLELTGLEVVCSRAEVLGRSKARESFDVVVARAVAPLPVLAELAVPLVRVQGVFIAMKGAISDQERIPGLRALAILGAETPETKRAQSFPGAENRWLLVARKNRATPSAYPRRPGIPAKRPLGGPWAGAGPESGGPASDEAERMPPGPGSGWGRSEGRERGRS